MDPSSPSRNRLLAWLLLSPMLLLIIASFVVPIAYVARISFYPALPGGTLLPGFTLSSYVEFVTDDFQQRMVVRSVLLSLLITGMALLLTYPIALFLHRTRSRWRAILIVIAVAPLLISAVVRTYGWMVILGENGLVNATLQFLGLPTYRLINNYTGVVIGLTEIMMPFMALALIAGFGRIDPTLEEAAATLGAKPMRRFWRVTFPLSLPGVFLGCMLCFVLTISAFVTPSMLGGGRVFLIASEIYAQALAILNWPLASAMSVLVLIVFTAALALYGRIGRRWAIT